MINLGFLIILPIIIVIGGIAFWRIKTRKGREPLSEDENWYLRFSLCREDVISQLMLLLAVFFLGVTLLAFNKDFGEPVSWQTILLFTSLLGLVMSYYFKLIYTLIFSLSGVVIWWLYQAIMVWSRNVEGIKLIGAIIGFIFIGLLFYIIGHIHEKEPKFKRFALIYLLLGIIIITGFLFVFSTKPGLRLFMDSTKGIAFWSSWQLSISLALFLVALVGTIIYALSERVISIYEVMAVILIAVLFGIIAFLPHQNLFIREQRSYFYGQELSSRGVLWAVIFNIFIFFELLGIILSGYLRREEWLINLGAIFLFLLIIVKYFDWFFTFLDKSIFFIGAGILLFLVGWFMEKGRRYMIAEIEKE